MNVKKPRRGKFMKILIFEDEPMFIGVLEQVFKIQGFETIFSKNVDINDSIEDVEIIMIDFSCIDTISYLEERQNNSNVIVMGGDIDEYEKEKIYSLGVKYILDKPFQIDELLKIIKKISLVPV